jgi:HlyD family secretion protein
MIKRIVFLALAAAVLYGTYTVFSDDEPSVANSVASLSVTVITPQQGSLSDRISATGMTIPREEIEVITELSGVRVREVLVDVGDVIKKGQKLAVLDGESLGNQFVQLKSDYERARDAFARVDSIKDTGAVSKQMVTEKRTAMQSAKASLDDAQLNLKRSTIIAPEAGVIFERKAIIGGLVSNSEPLFRIARHNEIEMEAMVPETALASLSVDQPVSITLTGNAATIDGAIRLITPRIDNATRMATIRISLKNADNISVGLFAIAQIMQSARDGWLLPKATIQKDSSGDFVWVLNTENKAERLPVTVILRGDEQVMVESISQGARVVARAGAFIKDGDSINVVEHK